jgi:primosomal protein N''
MPFSELKKMFGKREGKPMQKEVIAVEVREAKCRPA